MQASAACKDIANNELYLFSRPGLQPLRRVDGTLRRFSNQLRGVHRAVPRGALHRVRGHACEPGGGASQPHVGPLVHKPLKLRVDVRDERGAELACSAAARLNGPLAARKHLAGAGHVTAAGHVQAGRDGAREQPPVHVAVNEVRRPLAHGHTVKLGALLARDAAVVRVAQHGGDALADSRGERVVERLPVAKRAHRLVVVPQLEAHAGGDRAGGRPQRSAHRRRDERFVGRVSEGAARAHAQVLEQEGVVVSADAHAAEQRQRRGAARRGSILPVAEQEHERGVVRGPPGVQHLVRRSGWPGRNEADPHAPGGPRRAPCRCRCPRGSPARGTPPRARLCSQSPWA